MKRAKKILALVLMLALMATMGVCAFAEEDETTIIVMAESEAPGKLTVKCVDTAGATIRDEEGDYLDLSRDLTVDEKYARPEIAGYTYEKTTLDGEELTKLTVAHDAEGKAAITASFGSGESAKEKSLTGSETLLFVYTKDEAEHTHSWDEGKVTKEATCTEKGVKTFTCSCGETKTEEIEALGHDWGEPSYTWAEDNSSCTAQRVCKRDASHTESEQAKAGEKITKEPGCETKGEKTLTASFTATIFTQQTKTLELEALGHDWDAGKVTKEASCTEKGVKTFTCKRDSAHTKTEEIAALGHDYAHGRCKRCDGIDPAFQPKLTDRSSGVANWGSDYVVVSTAMKKDFQKVLVDGKELSASDYSVTEKDGNTVVTIKGSAVKAMKVGEHKIQVQSVTGTAEKSFNVSDKPRTGDTSTAVWSCLLGFSALAAGAVLVTVKRKYSAE